MVPALLAAALIATPQRSGVSVRLQAVSAAGSGVVWVSGLEGTYVRSLDSGESWQSGVVAGAETLELRDVHAVDARTAYVMSSGTGAASRLFKTTDGGASWKLLLVNPDPEGFFDCFDFWDGENGLLYGDSVAGKLVLFQTKDGETWTRLPAERLPDARPGEGGFAASGTCLVTVGDSTAYVGTGAGSSRVLRTRDRGKSWDAFETPIPNENPTAGITSLAFRDEENGIAAGGDISSEDPRDVVAVLEAGGARLATPPTFAGAIYGMALSPSSAVLVAVGPKGASYSLDFGRTWTALSEDSYWAVGFAPSGIGWMVGPEGRIARLDPLTPEARTGRIHSSQSTLRPLPDQPRHSSGRMSVASAIGFPVVRVIQNMLPTAPSSASAWIWGYVGKSSPSATSNDPSSDTGVIEGGIGTPSPSRACPNLCIAR
jgi:photosystem II stability/assembly factor-like uncharacterized protein